MPGRLGDERRVEGWPNLVQVARLAQRHFDEISDPGHGHMAYVGAGIGLETPVFVRSLWDWVEAASYGLPGRIGARRLTGDTSGEEVEIGQRKLTLAAFHNLDGFAHRTYARGWSEDLRVVLWEQARVLVTLMAWFTESQDERLLVYVRGMLQALQRISHVEGGKRIFQDAYWREEEVFGDVGRVVLVEPLMKYHELTGDPEALDFCAGIIEWVMAPETNFVDSQYRFSGWLRGLAAALASITRYATAVGDACLIERCRHMLDSAIDLTTRFGATPDTEPCCTSMELTTSALSLARVGYSQYWDDVDRWFRNHTLECQFRDVQRLKRGCIEGEPQPYDDTRDILQRSLGGFSWATARERRVHGAALMLCCGGNAMWTMGKLVANAVEARADGIAVNLHFSVDTPLAAVTNCEPFEGRLEVVPRRDGSVRVRKPSYAGTVRSRVGDEAATPGVDGEYLVFDGVRSGARVELTYDLPERTTEETTLGTPHEGSAGLGGTFGPKSAPVVKERIQATWRGNTVLAVDYEEESEHPAENRLYLDRMEQYRTGQGREGTARFFLPDRPFTW